MRTQDEISGKFNALAVAKQSKEVQLWLAEIKELSDNLTAQYMNEKGEEAIRAWGVIKGLSMAVNLDIIYQASIKSPIIKPHTILKP